LEQKKCPGKDCLSGFVKRNPSLSLRKPEETSLSRASGFNKIAVENVFNLLHEIMQTYKFHADGIYNIDETGISTTQVPTKVIAKKGLKQVGKIVSQERGKNVTAVCCANALGPLYTTNVYFPTNTS
jgi:hypothetical protein